MDNSSSDDNDKFIYCAAQIVQTFLQCPKKKHDDSVPGYVVLHKDREGGQSGMYQDYLTDDPTCLLILDAGLYIYVLFGLVNPIYVILEF